MRRAGALTLADGRSLGFAEFGDPAGAPIPYFHGHPGSRLEAALLDESANRCGVRPVGTDRPEIGLSDFQPRRRILDWPADVEQLADALGLARFQEVDRLAPAARPGPETGRAIASAIPCARPLLRRGRPPLGRAQPPGGDARTLLALA